MGKKPKKEKFVDDGRVISNMNVEGMRGTLYKRSRRKRFDEFGDTEPKREPVELTRGERRAVARGVSIAMIAVLTLFVALLVAIGLFISKVWIP